MSTRLFVASVMMSATLLLPSAAKATTTLFLEGPTSVQPGVDVTYALRATITEAINAVAVTLRYDSDLVPSLRFIAADSVIRQWLERSHESGALRLEGIIPGGTAPVFTDTVPVGYVTVRFGVTGRTTLTLADAKVFLHQPVPTEDTVTVRPLTVSVAQAAPAAEGIPPSASEEVYATVFHEPQFQDDAWSVLYDIRSAEGPLTTVLLRERFLGLVGGWREISSPASLSDQLRLSILEIGIPDADGVRVVERIVPTRLVVLASVLGLLAIGFAVRRMKR